jgi:hypothetical protein
LRKLLALSGILWGLLMGIATHTAQTKTNFDWITKGLICIHHYEGAWNSNTGNGYYGGLQMDYGFMATYGSEFLRKYGTADRWSPWVQLTVARRAVTGYNGYGPRGFGPWPNTRRMCGI